MSGRLSLPLAALRSEPDEAMAWIVRQPTTRAGGLLHDRVTGVVTQPELLTWS